MRKNRNFFESMTNAFEGFNFAVKNETNLRIDISAAVLVCFFAYVSHISIEKIPALILTIAVVIIAELINTAIEQTVDAITPNFNLHAKRAKDVAAAVPLFAAFCAVVSGFFIFGGLSGIIRLIYTVISTPVYLILTVVILCADIIFITLFKTKDR